MRIAFRPASRRGWVTLACALALGGWGAIALRIPERLHRALAIRYAEFSSHLLQLTCLPDSVIAEVRQDPRTVVDAFAGCRAELKASLPASFGAGSDEELADILATVVAYRFAPYGHSEAVEWAELSRDSVLDCDNYVMLLLDLRSQLLPEDQSSLAIMGWDGGLVGNHAELFVSRGPGHELLLDPTLAIVARAPLDSVVLGKPIRPDQIIHFASRHMMDRYRGRIIAALRNGWFQHSTAIYRQATGDGFRQMIRDSYRERHIPGASN